MSEDFNFVVKVIALSAGLAIAIKYGGPFIPISASSAIALVLVLLPAGVMGGLLALRAWRSQ